MSEGKKNPEIEKRVGIEAESARQDSALERMLSRRVNGHDAPAGCPDAEEVAAYLDRSLDTAAYARCEEHFANCSRCQGVLAALAVSENAEVAAAAPATFEAEPRPASHVEPVRITPSHEPRRRFWAWLAPVAVAAAAFLIWFDLRPKPATEPVPNSTVALNAPSQNALPPAPGAPAPVGPGEESKTHGAHDANSRSFQKYDQYNGAIAPTTRAKKQASGTPVSPAVADRFGAMAPPPPRVKEALKDEAALEKSAISNELPPPLPLPGQPPSASPQAGAVGGRPDSTAANQNFVDDGRVQAQTGAAGLRMQSAPASRNAQAKAQPAPKSALSGAIGSVSESVEVVGGAAGGTILVTPTSGEMLWRIGARGQIERSIDSGNTWRSAPAGVASDLLAGAAPANGVAWIVGKSGVILRTTDGGAHWAHPKSPAIGANTSPDWSSVVATDADHATISSITGQSFATSDGGASWTPKQ